MSPTPKKKGTRSQRPPRQDETKRVMQFKVALQLIEPEIWRRIRVPSTYSFYALHVAIQDAFGWNDCHLHEFQVAMPKSRRTMKIGFPDLDAPALEGHSTLQGWELFLADFFGREIDQCSYIYDFGDDWHHRVVFEEELPVVPGTKSPVCIAGARQCPPEDCGGPLGYLGLLEAMADPRHENHEETIEWLGDDFDPEQFDPAAVRFADPRKQLRLALDDV